MRCIETLTILRRFVNIRKIKSNMRCIETTGCPERKEGRKEIKSNMRCIETADMGWNCKLFYR